MNGKPKDITDMVESGCSELDNIGVVARVNQLFSEAEGSGLVPLPLLDWVTRLREKLLGCNARCSPNRRGCRDGNRTAVNAKTLAIDQCTTGFLTKIIRWQCRPMRVI